MSTSLDRRELVRIAGMVRVNQSYRDPNGNLVLAMDLNLSNMGGGGNL